MVELNSAATIIAACRNKMDVQSSQFIHNLDSALIKRSERRVVGVLDPYATYLEEEVGHCDSNIRHVLF